MTVVSPSFDLDKVEWRRVTDPSYTDFKVEFEFSLLGYDLEGGRLDMLLRYAPGGHCRRHRHVASTVTYVLEGEQFMTEMLEDGTTKSVHRKKGDYAMALSDAHPHDEWGGPEGGTVVLSMTAPDGILFEYFDENMENGFTISIEQYLEAWNRGEIHGTTRPDAAAA